MVVSNVTCCFCFFVIIIEKKKKIVYRKCRKILKFVICKLYKKLCTKKYCCSENLCFKMFPYADAHPFYFRAVAPETSENHTEKVKMSTNY